MSEVTALQTESPMDTAGNGQQDKLPDISSITLSDSPDIISRELPSDDATLQTEDFIDKIVKDENDIRLQIGSDTQPEMSGGMESPSLTLQRQQQQQQQQSPLAQNIPPTQKQLLDLQHQAVKFSLSLDKMLIAMQYSLTDITNISLSCTELYSETINDTCTEIDSTIKSMYVIMTKCEALDKQGEAVDKLAKEVHDINIKLQHLERLYNK